MGAYGKSMRLFVGSNLNFIAEYIKYDDIHSTNFYLVTFYPLFFYEK